ncbi:hypothetical protein BH11MYX1_BH11MYX1_32740 [soil metagenome]
MFASGLESDARFEHGLAMRLDGCVARYDLTRRGGKSPSRKPARAPRAKH